jgi:hypothetical protein
MTLAEMTPRSSSSCTRVTFDNFSPGHIFRQTQVLSGIPAQTLGTSTTLRDDRRQWAK